MVAVIVAEIIAVSVVAGLAATVGVSTAVRTTTTEDEPGILVGFISGFAVAAVGVLMDVGGGSGEGAEARHGQRDGGGGRRELTRNGHLSSPSPISRFRLRAGCLTGHEGHSILSGLNPF